MSVTCKSCGSELSEQVKFCTRCGAVVSQIQAPVSRSTEDLSISTQPLSDADTGYVTNVSPMPTFGATEDLSAETQSSVGKTTQELTPVTEALSEGLAKDSAKTVTISQTQTAGFREQVQSESGGRMKLVVAGLALLLIAAVAGIYSLRDESSNSASNSTVAQNSASPSPTIASTPAAVEQKQPEEVAPAAETAEKTEKQGTDANRKTTASAKEKTAEAQPATFTEILQRGLDAQNSGRYRDALSEFQKASQLDPTNANVYYLIGSAHHKLGQLDQALAAYRQCTSGPYTRVAAEHVKNLEKKSSKSKY